VTSLVRDWGVGVGYRDIHSSEFMENPPPGVSWIEILSENYLAWKNAPLGHAHLEILEIRRNLPVFMHGISLSLASTEPLDRNYLKRLKELAEILEPEIISDHLSWSRAEGAHMQNLVPFPYTSESLKYLVEQIDEVQNFLGRPILLENPSAYMSFQYSEFAEWDFLKELTSRTSCGLLLDINNVYVSGWNLGFEPKEYLKNIPHHRVEQIHLAGHRLIDNKYLFDTHDQKVNPKVWELFRWYAESFPVRNIMLERDDNIPEWSEMEIELNQIKEIYNESKTITPTTAESAI